MRLLFVTQDFPPQLGGIQRYAAELAAALSGRCEHLLVLSPRARNAKRFDARLSYRVERLWAPPDGMPLATLHAVLAITRRERFDVCLHAQWATAGSGLLARSLGRLERVAIAAHGRELLLCPFERVPPLQLVYDELRGRLLRGADRVVAVSKFTGSLVEEKGVESARVRVVPNGTNPVRFSPIDTKIARSRLGLPDRPLVLTVARLVPRKGIDTTLRALVRVRERLGDVSYAIAGSGPDAERLRALAESLGVSGNVSFVGDVSEADLPLWYAACDVFVMPARNEGPSVEGFGLVFLEAGACGKAVIGARAGGVTDAIAHAETGLLVEPGEIESLADAMVRLLGDRELAARMGAAGRERAETHSWDRVAERMIAALG